MTFDNLLDSAARIAQKTFRFSVTYFYEDRKTGERFAFAENEKPIETALNFEIQDPTTGMTVSKKGRGFLFTREVKEKIDVWRAGMNIDITEEPTPFGGDYIVVAGTDDIEKKYQIDTREPYSTIGSNNALFRANTFLSDGTI